MVHPKVLIGVPTSEFGRRADFYDYFNTLDKPDGTLVISPHGSSPAKNRNLAIEQAILNNCTHVLFLDDDMAFKRDLLTRLLSHDKDIVTGLYYGRNYPHQPMIFDKVDERGRAFAYFMNGHSDGLVRIAACGLGCCLIKIKVFEAMEKPWIRLGELDAQEWCDDLGFFHRASQVTSEIYCDTECMVGHISTMILWPNKVDGKWFTIYDTNNAGANTGAIQVPQVGN